MKSYTPPLFVALLLISSVASFFHTGYSEPTPQRFRGVDASGGYTAKGLPSEWTEADYQWQVTLPGNGHSSPIAWNNRLYLTSTDGGKPGSLLLCYAADTGKEVWRLEFEASDRQLHKFNTFASSTTAVDEHHVYIAWSDAENFQIAAVDHSGKGVWQRNLGSHHTQHGGGISPVVYEDLVIIPNDCRGPSSIHALNRMTGEIVWKVDRPWEEKGKTSYSTPLLYQAAWGEPLMIFNSTSSGMTAVNPSTGETVWQLKDLFPKRTIMSPIQVGELIYSSCGDGNSGFFLVAIRPPVERGEEATIAYQIRKSAPYVPTPVAKDDRLFLLSDGGIATCIEASTGHEIWKGNLRDTFFSSPIRIDDRIFAVSRRADVVVFKAGDEFEILGRTLINQETNATPIVHNEKLYLRTLSHLYCLGEG
jgi:outer membrane protein assembly factor BamB